MIETPKRSVKFVQISRIALLLYCFHYWLWASKWWLGSYFVLNFIMSNMFIILTSFKNPECEIPNVEKSNTETAG